MTFNLGFGMLGSFTIKQVVRCRKTFSVFGLLHMGKAQCNPERDNAIIVHISSYLNVYGLLSRRILNSDVSEAT